jgi:hypothetical protein
MLDCKRGQLVGCGLHLQLTNPLSTTAFQEHKSEQNYLRPIDAVRLRRSDGYCTAQIGARGDLHSDLRRYLFRLERKSPR